jgi:hypothetical protein
MCGNILCVAAVLLGIDAGWRRLPDGGLEYQIQIEPEVIANAGSSGVLIQSDVPPEARDIRSFRITVGKAQLAQESLPPAEVEPAEPGNATANKPAADPSLPPPSMPAVGFEPNLPPPSMPAVGLGPNWLPPMDRPASPDAGAGQSLPGAPAKQEPMPAETTAVPRTLLADPSGRPLEVQPAVHLQPAGSAPGSDKTPSPQPTRPWLAMTLTLLALFASLGGNVFLVWIAADFRRRYRTLARRMGEVATG